MDRTADLSRALQFVIERIEEEARRSGEPLTEEQRSLLNDLPTHSTITHSGDPWALLPRDTAYERLCGLAKDAHQNDMQLHPTSVLDWEFAAAVLKFHRHPMSWLLQWAGVKERRPWWDQWLLLAAGLVAGFSLLALLLFGANKHLTRFQWAGVATAYATILILLHSASRRIEDWQLELTIERCRSGF
jgi:hypothetical protein